MNKLIEITGWNKEDESIEDEIVILTSEDEEQAIAFLRERSLIVEVGEVRVSGTTAVTSYIEPRFTVEPPKAKKGFLHAGPTPDGGFISRRTDNDYAWAVAILDTQETVVDGRDYFAPRVPNPTLNTWVSFSWHRSLKLATSGLVKAQNLGYRAVVIPVTPCVEDRKVGA